MPVTLAASLSETARAKPLPAAVRLQHPPWRAEEAGCPAAAKESLRGARGQGASPAWLLHVAERGPPARSPAVLPPLLTCCTSPPHFPEPQRTKSAAHDGCSGPGTRGLELMLRAHGAVRCPAGRPSREGDWQSCVVTSLLWSRLEAGSLEP